MWRIRVFTQLAGNRNRHGNKKYFPYLILIRLGLTCTFSTPKTFSSPDYNKIIIVERGIL